MPASEAMIIVRLIPVSPDRVVFAVTRTLDVAAEPAVTEVVHDLPELRAALARWLVDVGETVTST